MIGDSKLKIAEQSHVQAMARVQHWESRFVTVDFNSFLEEGKEGKAKVCVVPRLVCWSSEKYGMSAATTTSVFS